MKAKAGCSHGSCPTPFCPACGTNLRATPPQGILAHLRKRLTVQKQVLADRESYTDRLRGLDKVATAKRHVAETERWIAWIEYAMTVVDPDRVGPLT